jgi:hypothetical protein
METVEEGEMGGDREERGMIREGDYHWSTRGER